MAKFRQLLNKKEDIVMAKTNDNMTFEENIQKLEEIIKNLEGGNISLDKMLSLFEEGISCTKKCSAQLKNAEQKITVMMKNNDGELQEEPFEEK
jgi:exodeoxyribonuclease VII small subunit